MTDLPWTGLRIYERVTSQNTTSADTQKCQILCTMRHEELDQSQRMGRPVISEAHMAYLAAGFTEAGPVWLIGWLVVAAACV